MMERDDLAGHIKGLLDDCDLAAQQRSQKRRKALDYFNGQMQFHIPSDQGRSSFVSKDVRATIKKIMPSIKRTILGSDQVVEYKPMGPEDVKAAKDATIFVNKVTIPENGIEDAISDAIMSALLLDEGFLTWMHEEKQRVSVTYHSGITEQAFAILQQNSEIEVLEVEEYEADVNGMAETLYRVRIKRTITESRVKAISIPAEDFIIHPEATSEDDAPLIGHIMRLRRSDLVAMGYDRELVDDLPRAQLDPEREMERDALNPDYDQNYYSGHNGVDGALEPIEVYRLFVRVDADNDGIAELREVHYVKDLNGEQSILFDDYADDVEYAILVGERIMHSWQGMSLFDDAEDIQDLKTVLTRQILDNLYEANNPQPIIQAGTILNPESVSNPEFGKPILARQGVPSDQAISWRAVPFFAEKTFPMLEAADRTLADRTGITLASSALDPQALQNIREKGVDMISDAAAAQAWCIVREIANGGLRRLFRGILKLLIQHQDPRQVQIGGNWISFDPRSWNAGMNCVVNVGLGAGTRERDMQALSVVASYQEKVLEAFGPQNPFVGPQELFNTLIKITEAAGLTSPTMFFKEPNKQSSLAPPQGPSIDEVKAKFQQELEMVKAQSARDKEEAQAQADIAVKQVEAQLKAQEAEYRTQLEADKANRKLAFDVQSHNDKMALEWAKLGMERPQIDPETGEMRMTQTEQMMAMLAHIAERINAPRRKTAIAPNGKTYEIIEHFDDTPKMESVQ